MRQFSFPRWLFIASCAFSPSIQAVDMPPGQPPVSLGPAWSQSLQLSGVTSTNGEHCVYLFNPTTGAVTTLTLGEAPHNGLKLEALENTDDPARCSVVISRNGEKAVLRPLDYTTEVTPILASAPNPVAEGPEDTDEKPAPIREWNGPRFDLEAAKAAAAARQAQEN
ncbi:MAG: hypothetical protein R3F13_00875 [Prosthecobacter sp.]